MKLFIFIPQVYYNFCMKFCIFIPQTVTKPVFKGMLTMVKALIQGLELTYQNQGMGGMSSALNGVRNNTYTLLGEGYWIKQI